MAAPVLADPNFSRTVVLLLAYGDEGALGVVLNRPSETPVEEVVPAWAERVTPPGVLFTGGPVQPEAAICVGHHLDPTLGADLDLAGVAFGEEAVTLGEDDEDEDDPFGGYSPLTSTLGTVDLRREPEEIAVALGGLRVFKGYAGWGPGQLDDELEEKAWFVLEGSPDDVLTDDPGALWERVLRRQGGWLAVLARHPVDPMAN